MTIERMKKQAEETLTKEYPSTKNQDVIFARGHAKRNAERLLEVVATVEKMTEDEKAQLRAMPAWKDYEPELRPIKEKYALSWNELKMVASALQEEANG
jgi:ABC-type Fe3+-hydroxamate transport system substrate-binding protein